MPARAYVALSITALAVGLAGMSARCGPRAEEVVAGSSLIQAIIRDLTGTQRRLSSLLPPGMCPGHFDVRPSDIEALADCRALIIHEWQRPMANVKGIIEAAGLSETRIKVAKPEGNWMVPAVQAEAVRSVARILAEVQPEGAARRAERAAARSKAVLLFGAEVKRRLEQAEVAHVRVLCDEMQAPFVKWAGFDIVAAYGRPEELSVADIQKLIQQARKDGVVLVIDNLQSGDTKISEALARDADAIQVVLSNFPGAFEDTQTWEKALQKNVDLLLTAIDESRQKHG